MLLLYLNFAKRLAQIKKPVWLRFVLVPGLSDGTKMISNIAGFAAECGNIERVDVLPFHQLGEFKWKELGLKYSLEGLEPPPLKRSEWFVNNSVLKGSGLY